MLAARSLLWRGRYCTRGLHYGRCSHKGMTRLLFLQDGGELTNPKLNYFSQLSCNVKGIPSKYAPFRCISSVAVQEIREESNAETVEITYVGRDCERHVIKGKVGDNVMYLAQRHDLDVEGACEASLACCTCHVYVKKQFYDMLDEPTEEEEDMLDLAPFLQENSRLSCQIILTKELNGVEVQLPSASRNFYVDGHKPKPH